MNINQECSHNKRGAGPIHLVECKAKPISFNSFYTSGVKVFKIDKANSEGHVLSKIKTNSCYALVCFIFDKTFLLVLYPLHKGQILSVFCIPIPKVNNVALRATNKCFQNDFRHK